ncbi:uncharacterized protein [Chiloscyllium punctatum]|uniref:uncharacterized protein n=1 Tax=Chiloscyllium punctatum TaxID=137246 RepID=UPI003B640894
MGKAIEELHVVPSPGCGDGVDGTQKRKRYWETGEEISADAAPAPAKGSRAAARVKVAQRKPSSRRSMRGKHRDCPASMDPAKKVLSGKRKRYWETGEEISADAAPAPAKGSKAAARVKVAQRKPSSRRSMRGKHRDCPASMDPAKKVLSGREDPFAGPAPIPNKLIRKFNRGASVKVGRITDRKVRNHLKVVGDLSKAAAKQAARFELLLPEDAG